MSYIKRTKRSTNPNTPGAGKITDWYDTSSPYPIKKVMDENGVIFTPDTFFNAGSTANQTGFASDTYLAGSNITVPCAPKAGVGYRLTFDMTKTAAGTAAPTVIVRFGTAGTVADTARLTFTWGAGTAAADTGIFYVTLVFRSVGASGIISGLCECSHHLAATGLISTGGSGAGILTVTSSGFDTTVANSIIGVSFNGGASFSGTNTMVMAEAWGF